MKKQFIECGKITSTHGIKGELKVFPFTEEPQHLLGFDSFFLDDGETKLVVLNSRIHKKMLLLTVEGVDSMDTAAALRGKIVYLNREEDIDTSPYLQDFIGVAVSDIDTGKDYGKIVDIIITGANNVFVLKDSNAVERLIPDIDDVVIEYDLNDSFMKIRPLEGLFEDED